ncbi:polyprenyl synthetase family protein [Saccharophagus degradans]|uniref:Octaprenyl diphosphate synthase n=1 Tax=Saccharophagus degradans TaxID=86304 RepID=A0AAW7XBS4_9GAMM|nr:polyprenyl synthetase family protein [Saccharophagus degradans]MDO6424031.1 polyprenyl synthetase family protein [Saccharophagus degradans]MDO6609400.1 polyprenyl synthetase family protein [Saccharophagus degradans]
MQSFYKVVQEDFAEVNTLIVNQLHSDVGLVENIGHYIVDAGGKRLRPLLVLLTARALGYSGNQHLSLSAIIEFIHTATLLHDDVVDVSALRRGRPTANANWGNAPSVLVGDFLYSRAFQMMVEIGEMGIMKELANTTNVISEGEVQQLVNARNPEVTEQNYMTVIHKKTAALFEAACETAAILAGADATTRKAVRSYGYHLGVAFQLVDDVLDYQGDAEELGKNVGDDLAEGKPTLPLIYTINNGSAEEAKLVKQAIINSSLDKLQQIVDIVQRRGGLEYTQQCAQDHINRAKQAIALLPETEFRSAMEDLADFAIKRNH